MCVCGGHINQQGGAALTHGKKTVLRRLEKNTAPKSTSACWYGSIDVHLLLGVEAFQWCS